MIKNKPALKTRTRAAVIMVALGAGLLTYLGITTQSRGGPNLLISTRMLVDEPFPILPAIAVLSLVVGIILWITSQRKQPEAS